MKIIYTYYRLIYINTFSYEFLVQSFDALRKAIVSLQDRIVQGSQTHEEGFAEWLRQRDQQAMVLTDKDHRHVDRHLDFYIDFKGLKRL